MIKLPCYLYATIEARSRHPAPILADTPATVPSSFSAKPWVGVGVISAVISRGDRFWGPHTTIAFVGKNALCAQQKAQKFLRAKGTIL